MDDTDTEPSARQREWATIAGEVRGKLRSMVPMLPAMTPEEAYRLIEAMSSAFWLDVRAATMDRIVDEAAAKNPTE